MALSGAEDEKNPFGRLIGLHFSGWGDGQSVCHLAVTPALLNPNGVLHGAAVMVSLVVGETAVSPT